MYIIMNAISNTIKVRYQQKTEYHHNYFEKFSANKNHFLVFCFVLFNPFNQNLFKEI